MNIIFTDIDGVLNPHWKKVWSKKAIAIFNRICKDFNLVVVITSSWRTNHTIEQLQKIFDDQGIEVKIHDYTPFIDQADRGLEIKEYLSKNKCEKFVIIDDKTSNIEPHVKNAVKCQSWVGLTEEQYDEIKEILSK